MPDILRLTAIFALIVVLLSRRVNVGLVMLLSAVFLAVLYTMPPGLFLDAAVSTLTDPVTVKLIIALTLIRVYEVVLREREMLADMTEASKALFRNRKAAIVSMPLLIGMIPTVGGAYFSAPMVDEATKSQKMTQEEKGFVNYWFRHPWEFVLPLYPGIVLASAITGLKLWSIILVNLLPAALMAAGGFALSMKHVEGRIRKTRLSRRGVLSFLPITMVLTFVVVFRLELHMSFLLVIAGLFAVFRYRPADMARALRKGASLDFVVLILGVMLFKHTMEASGSVASLSEYFTALGIPLMPVLVLLPFITGVLTGLTIGFVSATFPLLMSLGGGGELSSIALAFAAGYTGVLLSPVHVCLILTREYFKADMSGIYRRTLPASAMVMAGAALMYLLW